MSSTQNDHPVIWHISDGRSGHDTQSKGLLAALNQIKPCDSYHIEVTNEKFAWLHFLCKQFPAGEGFPDPDIIIGTGHHTHLSVLTARRARGGKAVVIMKPSLPVACFDFCFIPEHDEPGDAENVLTTKGAINCITVATEQNNDQGLILVGGPSKHFYWNNEYLMQQIKEIINRDAGINWKISDSIRTPEETRQALQSLHESNAEYNHYQATDNTWVVKQLNRAASVWVSADSVSMIYESLTSGAAVGLLDVPAASESKLTNNIAGLVEDKMVSTYNKWLNNGKLEKPPVQLNEARRCAEHLVARGLLQ